MILSERAQKARKGYRPVNDRLMYTIFTGYRGDITTIEAYAPTTDHSDEEVEAFFEAIERLIDETAKGNI